VAWASPAIARTPCRLELVNEGTLFLDQEMPLDLQPKLVRALEEREKLGIERSDSQ